MCGRLRQAGDGEQYMETLNWNPKSLFDDPKAPKYNVAPGTRPLTLHRLGDGSEQIGRLFWGYEPAWGKTGPAVNAKFEKILANSAFWRGTLERRVIVPADGWYEWTGEKPDKQPWFIQAKDGRPILLAAVSGWKEDAPSDGNHGFSIVTDAAAGELKEIHLRRPLVLTPNDALEWLDPATTTEQAKDILSAARPESAFQWWQVTRAMGNSRYQMADASEPISLTDAHISVSR